MAIHRLWQSLASVHLSGSLADCGSCLILGFSSLFLDLVPCFLGLLLHILSSDTHRQASWTERGWGCIDRPAIEARLVCLHPSMQSINIPSLILIASCPSKGATRGSPGNAAHLQLTATPQSKCRRHAWQTSRKVTTARSSSAFPDCKAIRDRLSRPRLRQRSLPEAVSFRKVVSCLPMDQFHNGFAVSSTFSICLSTYEATGRVSRR